MKAERRGECKDRSGVEVQCDNWMGGLRRELTGGQKENRLERDGWIVTSSSMYFD